MLRKSTIVCILSVLLIGAMSMVGLGTSLWGKVHKAAEEAEWEDPSGRFSEAGDFLPNLGNGDDGSSSLLSLLIHHQTYYLLVVSQIGIGYGSLSTIRGYHVLLYLLYGRLQLGDC